MPLIRNGFRPGGGRTGGDGEDADENIAAWSGWLPGLDKNERDRFLDDAPELAPWFRDRSFRLG